LFVTGGASLSKKEPIGKKGSVTRLIRESDREKVGKRRSFWARKAKKHPQQKRGKGGVENDRETNWA